MVASKCGIGYGRNARTSAKKLFEKLRNAAGVEGTAATDAASNTVADGEAADDGAVKKPKAKKAPVKKGVGKVTAPKKASGGGMLFLRANASHSYASRSIVLPRPPHCRKFISPSVST